MRDFLAAVPLPCANRRAFLRGTALLLAGAAAGVRGAQSKPPELNVARTPERVTVRMGEREICAYQLRKPSGTALSVDSACYVHPLATPAGTVVTEVAPDDHRHHRGMFLAWVEMHGAKDADFWGWGERAPLKDRRIVNRTADAPPPALGYARIRFGNDWLAEGQRLLAEDLRIGIGQRYGANVLDVSVQLTADAPVTLARCAFGGFALRARKEAQITAIGPEGPVNRPPPVHTAPESNWPDAPWYGLHLRLPEGKEATVVVVGRAANPPTSWHVVPAIGLLNPAITGPAAVQIVPAQPLVLRYRVATFDGAPNPRAIEGLVDGWYRPAA